MKIRYLCPYCDKKVEVFTYYDDYDDTQCPYCKQTLKEEHVFPEKDVFGYNKKARPIVVKGDIFGYEVDNKNKKK